MISTQIVIWNYDFLFIQIHDIVLEEDLSKRNKTIQKPIQKVHFAVKMQFAVAIDRVDISFHRYWISSRQNSKLPVNSIKIRYIEVHKYLRTCYPTYFRVAILLQPFPCLNFNSFLWIMPTKCLYYLILLITGNYFQSVIARKIIIRNNPNFNTTQVHA